MASGLDRALTPRLRTVASHAATPPSLFIMFHTLIPSPTHPVFVLSVCSVCISMHPLPQNHRDPTLTTIVTLLSAYSSYYVADRLVGSSGLLAVVCNGFTMSLIGGWVCWRYSSFGSTEFVNRVG